MRALCRRMSTPAVLAGGPKIVTSESYNCPAESTLTDIRPKSAACFSAESPGRLVRW
jgi:hypothetical protein